MVKRYPEAFDKSTDQFERIRLDTDPFILEQRAYERICRFSSKENMAFFPTYYGSICEKRALVIELLRPSPSLKSRCICSNSFPDHFDEDLRILREETEDKKLSALEARWYESLFIDRLKRLTAMHSIGITHGDIKEDSFRLFNDFHDTVLFDFSHAYTIMPQRPCAVQGFVIDSRFSERWATRRSMQKLVELERNWVRSLIRKRYDLARLSSARATVLILMYQSIENNDFRLRYGHQFEEIGDRELVVMKIFRKPEG